MLFALRVVKTIQLRFACVLLKYHLHLTIDRMILLVLPISS